MAMLLEEQVCTGNTQWSTPVEESNILQSIALSWLGAALNLLLTATLLYNFIEDFKGLMPLLWNLKNNATDLSIIDADITYVTYLLSSLAEIWLLFFYPSTWL